MISTWWEEVLTHICASNRGNTEGANVIRRY